MDTAIQVTNVELRENVRTEFSKLCDVLKPVCCLFDQDFWQLNENHKMETGDSPFGNVDLGLTYPPYNGQSKSGKANSGHDVFTVE